jgi:cbb3-type cytochrome oxidase subunit 3
MGLIAVGALLLLGAAYAWWRSRKEPAADEAESNDSVGVGS